MTLSMTEPVRNTYLLVVNYEMRSPIKLMQRMNMYTGLRPYWSAIGIINMEMGMARTNP